MKHKDLVIVVSGCAITLETLKRNCRLHMHPDGYADTLWRSYWNKKNAGQDRTGALNELVRICFTESEFKKLIGQTIKES